MMRVLPAYCACPDARAKEAERALHARTEAGCISIAGAAGALNKVRIAQSHTRPVPHQLLLALQVRSCGGLGAFKRLFSSLIVSAASGRSGVPFPWRR
jgi:hypothetical protein